MEQKTLLNDLMMLSDRIENHINDLLASCIQEEYDTNRTQNRLINEAINVLLDILEENGIYFHIDREDILENRYGIGFIMFLYKNFSTVNIVHTIKSTPGYLNRLNIELLDTPNSEILVHMINTLRKLTLSGYHGEAYCYLQDKIYNDDRFMCYMFTVLDVLNINADNTFITFTENDKSFIEKLSKERHWFELCITDLVNKGALPIDNERIKQLVKRFCLIYSSPEHIHILADYKNLVENHGNVVQELMDKIHSRSDIHIEYYTDSDISKLQICTITAIILAKISDYHLFGIEPNFDRLIQYCSSDIPIKNLIEMIPNRSSLSEK